MTSEPKAKPGFWKRLGYYTEVFVCLWLVVCSLLVTATGISRNWAKINDNLLWLLWSGYTIAFMLTWWICLWNTGKGSLKKLLDV